MGKISTLVLAVVDPGAGNVVRSFVHLTSIQIQGKKCQMLKSHIMPTVANKRRNSNRRSTALVDIIVIVRSGGTNRETLLAWEYPAPE